MIEVIKLTGSDPAGSRQLKRILGRTGGLDGEILARSEAVVRDVKDHGDEALLSYTARFDGVELKPEMLRASREMIEELAAQVDESLIAAMREAIGNIRRYHEHQLTGDWEI